MRDVREVMRLHREGAVAMREIARMTGVARSTVRDMILRFERSDLSWPVPPEISDAELEMRLYGPAGVKPGRRKLPEPDWSVVAREMKRKHVTLQVLWEEYIAEHPDGYRYSRYCDLFRGWEGRLPLTMRQNHSGGEKLFIDYAGDKVPVIDRETGEVRDAHIFVAVMGGSSLSFALATWTEQMGDWIDSHNAAFAFFGGVPQLLVPDNAKVAVIKACLFDPMVNRSYTDMARHYGTAVLPTRPRKPRDKAKVEACVGIVERWLLGRLRNRIFNSLVELNAAIADCMARLNDVRVVRQFGKTRRQMFEEIDVPSLKPLPADPWVHAEWKRCRVGLDYHIALERHHYSVPYRYARREVEARFTVRTVEIFLGGERIAAHMRGSGNGRHTTIPEHMPSSHRRYGEWTPAKIREEAARIGPMLSLLVEKIIEGRPHPEQGYRSCLGIIGLEKRFGAERLEAAALRALEIQARHYRAPRGLDRRLFDMLVKGDWIAKHENCAIIGPTGIGKSWLACALGHQACRDNRSVLYTRLPRLIEELALAKGDGRIAARMKSLARVDLLILDDWGLDPLDSNARHHLLEILEDRYGRRATLVTSQFPVARWHELIGDPTYADAILDRLVHNAHRLEISGESMRRQTTTVAA